MSHLSIPIIRFRGIQRPPPESPLIQCSDPKGILRSGKIHPELVRRIEALIEEAHRHGLNLYVQEGFRSMEEQRRLFHSGRGVTNARPGYSFHNYGLAVDVVFRDDHNRPSWSEHNNWELLGSLGKKLGLEWGGDWKHLKDRAHFQLVPNRELPLVRELYQKGGIENVWRYFFKKP